MNLDDYSFMTAARTLWMEARGEDLHGQMAVAYVLVNRLKDGRWGKTFASVCWSRKQFSCWNESDPNRMTLATLTDDDPLLVKLADILKEAYSHPELDNTKGAMWYYNPSIVTQVPAWAVGKPYLTFGNQRFFSSVN